jgi:hypothetical protein
MQEMARTKVMKILFWNIVFLTIVGGPANAVVYDSNSAIYIRQFENAPAFQAGLNPQYQDVQAVSSLSHVYTSAYGSDIQAYGELSTGNMGTRFNISTDTPGNGHSYIMMFDTLSFTTPASNVEVSYNFSLDGTLSYSGIVPLSGYDFGGADAHANLSIYDITDMPNWLELYDSGRLGTDLLPSLTHNLGAAVGSNAFANFYYDANLYQDVFVDSSGALFNINRSASGTFVVDPTRQYGIALTAQSSAAGQAASDFLSTSSFRFTDLNGASFTSGSGAFLSDIAPSPVPVPAAAWLFVPGLLGLIGISRRKIAIY